jgi:hypothetical protein
MAVITTSIELGGSSLLGSIGGSGAGIGFSSTGGRLVGNPFVDMVKETEYEDVLSVNATHMVFIMKAQLHRLLLVKMKDSSYPWITFEVNTPNLTNLTTVMQKTKDLPCNSEKVGSYEGSLLKVCEIADSVVERMEKYCLFSNNCQHFCNNLLLKLGLKTYKTTVGPRTTLEPDTTHLTARGLDHAYSSAISYAPDIVARATATAVGIAIGAPSTLVATRNRERHTQ